jgi:hypothetical protein
VGLRWSLLQGGSFSQLWCFKGGDLANEACPTLLLVAKCYEVRQIHVDCVKLWEATTQLIAAD